MYLFFIKEVVILSCHFSGHFFNIQFDRTGNRNAKIENIGQFSYSCTLNLTANTCNEKKSLFTDERNRKVKSLVNSIQIRFLKFSSSCWKEHL